MFNSRRLYYLGVVVFLFCMINGCRKPFEEKEPKPSQSTARSGAAKLTIDVEDMLAALPSTAIYNIIKDGHAKLYLERAKWEYTAMGLTVRIPKSESNYNFIYATKRYDAPEKTNVYTVRYWPGEGSSDADFTGVTEWIDFQDWKVYSVKVEGNTIISYMDPMPIAPPDWEPVMMAYGHFQISNGRMTGIDDCIDAHPDGNGGYTTFDGHIPCPPKVSGDGKGWLERLLDNVGRWMEGLFGGDGGSNSGQPGDGRGNGYGGTHNPYGDMGSYYNNTLDISQYPPAGGTMGGGDPGAPGGPNPGDGPIMFEGSDIGLNAQTYLVNDPNVFTVMAALNLNGTQGRWLQNHLDLNSKILAFLLQFNPRLTPDMKEDIARRHIQMMMTYPGYLDFVNNYDVNYPIGIPLLDLAGYEFTPGSANAPISNRNDYLKCFANIPGATYKVTLAVQQPAPGTRKPFALVNGKIEVGHTFLILEQNINGQKTIRSIGWYPSSFCTPFNPTRTGVCNNDQNHFYNVALVNNISGTDFMAIINEIKNDNHVNYDLNTYNCTNWAYGKVFMHPMDNIDATESYWPLGHGMNPGDMGEDIRPGFINLFNYQSILLNGSAPLNVGTCP